MIKFKLHPGVNGNVTVEILDTVSPTVEVLVFTLLSKTAPRFVNRLMTDCALESMSVALRIELDFWLEQHLLVQDPRGRWSMVP